MRPYIANYVFITIKTQTKCNFSALEKTSIHIKAWTTLGARNYKIRLVFELTREIEFQINELGISHLV